MAIPDYADERSYGNFSRGFVGSTHGDNGSNYRTSWNSQCDAEPTKMILTPGLPVCAYCGNVGLPLQPNIDRLRDYTVTSYTCVCKDAMDEQEWEQELLDMENSHYEEKQALLRRKPKSNPEVVKGLIQKLTATLEKATTMDDVERILAKLKAIKED